MKKLFSWLGSWKTKGEAKADIQLAANRDLGRSLTPEEYEQTKASVETSSEVSQEAKDVISASEVFRNDLTEEEVAQARLKLNEVMKRLCSREE